MKNTMRLLLICCICFVGTLGFAGRVATITLDGDFSDWQAGDQLDISALAEASGDSVTDSMDILDVFACEDMDRLYVSVSFVDNVTVDLSTRHCDFFIDKDMDITSGFTGGLAGSPAYQYGPTGSPWSIGADFWATNYWYLGNFGGNWRPHTGATDEFTWLGGSSRHITVLGEDYYWGADVVLEGVDRIEWSMPRTTLGNPGIGDQVRFIVISKHNFGEEDHSPDNWAVDAFVYTFSTDSSSVDDWMQY